MKDSFPAFLILSGRYDHTCIRHCNSDTGHDFRKSVIVNTIVKSIRVNIICFSDSWHADSMRPYSIYRLQMLCMHQQAGKLIAVHFKTKENTAAHSVNSAFHGTVHSLCMIIIVMFWSCGMEFQITFLMVGLLKQNVGSDSCFFQLSVVFHSSSGNIYVYPADSAVFMFD